MGRKRIEKQAKKLGIVINSINYERPYWLGEKGGEAGGWTLQTNLGLVIAYTADEIIEILKQMKRELGVHGIALDNATENRCPMMWRLSN